MSIRLLNAEDILDFHASGTQYLAIKDGDFTYLGDDDITDGTALSYNYVTTDDGKGARILLARDTITDGDWFPDALEDGNLKPGVAAEMAEIVNQDAGLVRDLAVDRARETAKKAEIAADVAAAFATARALAIADVVSMCGGNQSEAARLIGIDQSRVSRLVGKVGKMSEPLEQVRAAAEAANRALAELLPLLPKSA